jgi:hypothetical protein
MLKKTTSFYLFIFSLLGVAIRMIYTLTSGISFGVGEIVGIILMPIAVAVFLIWYSNYVETKGWLNA